MSRLSLEFARKLTHEAQPVRGGFAYSTRFSA